MNWHQHCSTFLLGSKHSLSAIKLQESDECTLGETRQTWLEFNEANGVPVPENNPIMVPL